MPIVPFCTPGQHDGEIATLRRYLIPSYRTLTHPVVEGVPLVGAPPGQRRSRGLRFPQRTSGLSQYSCVGQRGPAG